MELAGLLRPDSTECREGYVQIKIPPQISTSTAANLQHVFIALHLRKSSQQNQVSITSHHCIALSLTELAASRKSRGGEAGGGTLKPQELDAHLIRSFGVECGTQQSRGTRAARWMRCAWK